MYVLFGSCLLFVMTNLTLVYMFLIHGYVDLSNTNYTEYSPYFFARLVNDAQVYVFVMAIIISVRSYGLKRKNELGMALMQLKNDELQSQLTKAQLQALRLQLNPHFLFNTLHTISSLTLVGEHKTSANVATRLGDFLRRTLDFEEQHMVSLSREIEFFDLYLDIESVRFRDRLIVEKDLEASSLYCKIPGLILQPLVENAIKHGISKDKSAKVIRLKTKEENQQLFIDLYNDGVLEMNHTQGIGIRNVRERLGKVYGKDFNFALQCHESGSGVMASLVLPVNVEVWLSRIK